MSGFEDPGTPPRLRGGAALYAPGVALLLLGFCILVLPDLLRYLIAGSFLGLGAIAVFAAHHLRRGRRIVRISPWLDRHGGPPRS